METKTNKEELIQETEVIEEEALKADKQKTKKIVKKILIGTGIAAIIGGVIAAARSNSKNSEICIDNLQDSDLVERTEVERTEVERTEIETSEN